MRRLLIALVLYAIMIALIILWKPVAIFDHEYKPRQFGLGQVDANESIFAPVVLFPALAIIAIFFSSWIDLISTPKLDIQKFLKK